MKASSCPNLNRETTSFPNFFTLFQHPDPHHDTTLNKIPKIGHGDDTTLNKSSKSNDTELSVTSPFKGILSTSLSVNETNENHVRIFRFFPEWDQKDRTLPKGPSSPNGSDAGVSPFKGILSTSLSVNETNENHYRIVGFFPEWDQKDRTLPKGSSSPNGSDAGVSVGSNEDIITGVSIATQQLLKVKRGVPWTEEEHRLFILGLQNVGKGDWREISRSYVTSRTPTQVASHARKYFIRRINAISRKRRSSLFLFDMVPEMDTDQPPRPEEQFMLPPSQAFDTDTSNSFPSLKLSLSQEFEPMETTSEEEVKEEAKETTIPSGEFPTADGQRDGQR